jgi:single-strand DNA-binding protein
MNSYATLRGNMTRDPDLKFLPSGSAVTGFGMAVNRRWQNRQTQEWEEQVSFFDVTAFGSLAENIAESLTKGTAVVVVGRLEQQSWEQEGQKRSKVVLVADDVAPSLRFATAQVARTERSDGGQGSGKAAPPARRPDPIEDPF